MALIVIRHLLADYDKWKQVFTAWEPMFGRFEIKSINTSMDKSNSSILTTKISIASTDQAKVFLETDLVKQALNNCGLSSRFEVELEEILGNSSVL